MLCIDMFYEFISYITLGTSWHFQGGGCPCGTHRGRGSKNVCFSRQNFLVAKTVFIFRQNRWLQVPARCLCHSLSWEFWTPWPMLWLMHFGALTDQEMSCINLFGVPDSSILEFAWVCSRSPTRFVEGKVSINSGEFRGRKCNAWIHMVGIGRYW